MFRILFTGVLIIISDAANVDLLFISRDGSTNPTRSQTEVSKCDSIKATRCGKEFPQLHLNNGQKTNIASSPWNVAIYKENEKNEYDITCGGTLISSNLVISGLNEVKNVAVPELDPKINNVLNCVRLGIGVQNILSELGQILEFPEVYGLLINRFEQKEYIL